MENVSLVVILFTFLSSTQGSEIFSSFRNMFGEKFENDSTLVWLLSLTLSDLNVKEDLRVLLLELWKPSYFLDWNRSFFLIIKSAREELLSDLPLMIDLLLLGCLDGLQFVSEGLVSRVELDGLLDVFQGTVIVLVL
jgi:hypothetical protein